MRTRDFIVVFVGLVAAAGLLYGAGAQLDYINAQRQAMKIVINPPLENAPPSLAFATVAMGAFRGLVVDILWMRADKLKDEGQFFDARQLAEWITTLQPRFAAVWEFHAWNMAYNISVAIPATQPEQRWRWVKNGYELLRDKGIPLNPKSIQLYRELARIFQHKLGGVSDDAQEYYKLQFAQEIGPLLESQDNGLGHEDNRYFEALIRSPEAWTQIANDPNVAPLIVALRAADESFAAGEDFVRNYLALRQEDSSRLSVASSQLPQLPAGDKQQPSKFKPAVFEVLNAYRGTEALKRFDIFAKAYQLRHVWKLDPSLMQKVSQTYGPIDFHDPNKHFPMDWRHPDSHAIYWAMKGLDVARQEKDREIGMQEVNTDRIVLHSLQNLFRYGKIMITQGPVNPKTEDAGQAAEPVLRKDIYLGPDPRVFDSYERAYQAVYKKYAGEHTREESYENGHRNMLKNAVLVFYQSGLKGEATKIYNELRKLYPREEFKVSLDQFARNRILEELGGLGITDASEQIASLLTNAYALYAIRDDNAASANEQSAQQVWDYYWSKYGPSERIALPSMRDLRYFAISQFLNSEAYPIYLRQRLLARIEIEKPDLLK
jgi:hypothetical protein